MEQKKTVQDEELNKVSGGCGADTVPVTCPNCGNCSDQSLYGRETTGSGCDEETLYTCPKCGYRFKR